MICAYMRVSSKEQNLDRQIAEIRKYGKEKNIQIAEYQEKQSGKDFETRTVFQKLKRRLKQGDILIICSIDRLGRNYEQILNEWKDITNKGCDIQVLDMPILNTKNGVEGLDGKFISNLVLQILAYVSQKEREKIKERQKQGIKCAMDKGVKFGRPKKDLPDNFYEIVSLYKKGFITNIQAVKELGISRSRFFRLIKEV